MVPMSCGLPSSLTTSMWSLRAKLCNTLHLVCIVFAGCCGRQGPSFCDMKRDGFLDHLTQPLENLDFIGAVTPCVNQPGRTADVAL